jgi:hypothetical protein
MRTLEETHEVSNNYRVINSYIETLKNTIKSHKNEQN